MYKKLHAMEQADYSMPLKRAIKFCDFISKF